LQRICNPGWWAVSGRRKTTRRPQYNKYVAAEKSLKKLATKTNLAAGNRTGRPLGTDEDGGKTPSYELFRLTGN